MNHKMTQTIWPKPQNYKPSAKRVRRTSSSISKVKTRNRKRTKPNLEAGIQKRELLEQVIAHEDYLYASGIYTCFPYFGTWPLSELAVGRKISNGFNGPRYCGNTHACPVCASRQEAIKREDFIAVAFDHEQSGGYLITQLLTLRHGTYQDSKEKYINLNKVWGKMLNKSAYKTARTKAGSPEYLKVQEEVLNETGWFPHVHIVWFFDKETTKKEANAFTGSVSALWSATANTWTSTGAHPKFQRPKTLTKGSAISEGWYLFKHGFHDLASDPKTFIKNGQKYSLKPFEVFQLFLITGEVQLAEAWLEFQKASYGTTRIKFSRGLNRRIEELRAKVQLD